MGERFEKGSDPQLLTLVRPAEVEAHIRQLRQLRQVTSGALNAIMEFDLRVGFTIEAFGIALQQVGSTDVLQSRKTLTPAQAARKLGVPMKTLLNAPEGQFPKPITHRGRIILYQCEDIDNWLLEHLTRKKEACA